LPFTGAAGSRDGARRAASEEQMQHRVPVEIQGKSYVIQHFMPSKALSVQIRLGKIGGKAFAGIGKSADAELITAGLQGFGEMLAGLDEKTANEIIKELLSCVYDSNDRPLNYEMEFIGRNGALWELVIEVLKVQYADFIESIAGRIKPLLAAMQAKAGEAQKSQNTFTGQSGG